jgi:hypothetical protein
MLGSSWVAAQLAASQEGLSSMSEWVNIIQLSVSMFIACIGCVSYVALLWIRLHSVTAGIVNNGQPALPPPSPLVCYDCILYCYENTERLFRQLYFRWRGAFQSSLILFVTVTCHHTNFSQLHTFYQNISLGYCVLFHFQEKTGLKR